MERRLAKTDVCAPLLERFTRYVKIDTTSDPHHMETKPSTQKQFDLARVLVEELKALGISDVDLDEHCFVLAKIPASPGYEQAPAVLFCSHLDTSSASPGANVQPQVHEKYDGGVIKLNGIDLDPELTPQLKECVGDTIVTSDGTTLLGGDDKAGIANIMTAIDEILNKHPVPHGRIEILFGADEEIGVGMKFVPLERMESRIGYTVDGHLMGELECECFTALNVVVNITGASVHPGYARGKMVNAVKMASSFIQMLPNERPETTDEYQGFFMVKEIEGGVDKATVEMIVRDFTTEAIEARQKRLEEIAKGVEAMYPGGKVEVTGEIIYKNMKEKLMENPKVVDFMTVAAERCGFKGKFSPIRGGTDGSRLTQMGVLTPNIFTGSYNHHGRSEFAVLSHMVAAVEMIIELVKLWSEEKQ